MNSWNTSWMSQESQREVVQLTIASSASKSKFYLSYIHPMSLNVKGKRCNY